MSGAVVLRIGIGPPTGSSAALEMEAGLPAWNERFKSLPSRSC